MVIRLAIGFLIILLIISGCAAESELEPTPEPLASFWARAEPAIADRRYGEAVEILEQAVVLYPEQTTLLLKIGQIYLIQHRWRLAEDAFNRAIAGGGASAAASAGLAEAWLNQGELIKARQMWQQAAALDPDLPGVFTGLGRTHLRLFEFEAAQAAFLEQQTHTPDFEADWYLATLTAPSDIKLGLSYLQSIPTPGDNGAPPIAESLLSRRDYLHQTLAPFSSSSAQADVAKAIGVALVQVEQWPLAIHALRLAVADNPIDQAQDAEAVAFLAHALGQAGKPALDLFEQARHLDPESALPLYFQGIYLRQQGAFKAAEEKLLRAIELDPDNAAIHAEMGRISEQAGNLTLAEAWYLAAIEVSDQEFAFQRLLLRFYANRS
ncbi:MAG: tetratricopeptide repeat protein, partial [Anaerolineae bacterium]|nr:tetratricopeptide repeat protein [Anaerolineae bacterium]